MSLRDEIAKLAAAVLADLKTAATAVDTVATNPLVAPFLPLIEQTVRTSLAAYGLPAADIDRAGQQLLASVLLLLTDAANASGQSTASLS